jgi:hypothetical protein
LSGNYFDRRLNLYHFFSSGDFMEIHFRILSLASFLACGLEMPSLANGALRTVDTHLNPAAACQLSIPTTDTQVRPKATGYRNESPTKSAFVICGFGRPTNDQLVLSLGMFFTSTDGVSRTINCTAVSGIAGQTPVSYVTKSVSSTDQGVYALMIWNPGDWVAVEFIPASFQPSVTCILPPRTAITATTNAVQIEIGS